MTQNRVMDFMLAGYISFSLEKTIGVKNQGLQIRTQMTASNISFEFGIWNKMWHYHRFK